MQQMDAIQPNSNELLSGDEYLSPAEISKRLTTRPSLATVFRWMSSRGVRGIRLQATKIGGRTVVSRRHLEEFVEKISQSRDGAVPIQPQSVVRSNRARRIALAAANQSLLREGVIRPSSQ